MDAVTACHWEESQVIATPGINLSFFNAHTIFLGPSTCLLTIDGVPVVVTWDHTANLPDTVTITPPVDFIAIPAVASIPEGGHLTVTIRERLLS